MIFVLGAKIIADGLFEYVGNPESTNWCIAVNFTTYLLYAATCMHITLLLRSDFTLPRLVKKYSEVIQFIFHVSGVIYATYAFIELSYIGVDFELYKKSMFDGMYSISHALIFCVATLVYFLLDRLKSKYQLFRWV